MEMNNVKKIYINGTEIKNELDFHNFLIRNFDNFGEFYGCNLDAFWDVISTGAFENIHIHWKYHDISKKNLGYRFDSIIFFLELLKKEIKDNQYNDNFDYFLE